MISCSASLSDLCLIPLADINHWPQTDVLISFFSTDFPLAKAIAYTKLPSLQPSPIVINDLPMQSVLWDRRLVLSILDHIGVPTPRRVEVSRDGGPVIDENVREKMKKELGLVFGGWGGEGPHVEGGVVRGKDVQLREDGDAVIVNGTVVEKPFVEKACLDLLGSDVGIKLTHIPLSPSTEKTTTSIYTTEEVEAVVSSARSVQLRLRPIDCAELFCFSPGWQ